MQINAQPLTMLLMAAFCGASWCDFHPPGIHTLPAGSRGKSSIHRVSKGLLDTPLVPAHPQGHGWGALPVASSTVRHPERKVGAAEIVVGCRQGHPPAQSTYTVRQHPVPAA